MQSRCVADDISKRARGEDNGNVDSVFGIRPGGFHPWRGCAGNPDLSIIETTPDAQCGFVRSIWCCDELRNCSVPGVSCRRHNLSGEGNIGGGNARWPATDTANSRPCCDFDEIRMSGDGLGGGVIRETDTHGLEEVVTQGRRAGW
jgi:hypothetical protein